MFILILFAFVAGIVTILSPCILPILPIVLSGSVTGGKIRPYGVIVGFIASFTFFTLFLSIIVKATGISASNVRLLSVFVLAVFGLTILIPRLQEIFEKLASRLTALAPKKQENEGFLGGILIGISLGLVWTPCVGPILASVLTIAAGAAVGGEAILITLAFSFGTSIPLLLITHGGRTLLAKVPWLVKNSGKIQKAFGVLMIATALGIFFNLDRKFQAYILTKFPAYGAGLTAFENNKFVLTQLDRLEKKSNEKKKGVERMIDFLDTDLGTAPELKPGGRWFNLPADRQIDSGLTMEELRGKVVLIDFWTYTCINCIRTLPYLKTWHYKYKDKGLVIIGVHTPEFEFEKDPQNVADAIKDFEITYPVMQDNDYATWNAYNNRYWPAKYLIDAEGKIYYTHFGEGAYNQTEKAIQTLLAKIDQDVSDTSIDNPDYSVSADTREAYLGYRRMEYLAPPQQVELFTPTQFKLPGTVPINTFAFDGVWRISDYYATPQLGSTLVLHFDAAQVFLVMKPKGPDAGQVNIIIDGNSAGREAGADVINGIVTVDSDRLYKLIKLDQQGKHILKLEFLDNHLELYAFTFG